MSVNPNTNNDVLQCTHCTVRHRAVCGALRDDELWKLNQISRRRKVEAGQVIFSDEEEAGFFCILLEGVVKLTKTLVDGRQQIVGLLFPSDFLGRAYSGQRSYFAEAATQIELCCFPHDEFERLLKEFPDVEHRLFEHTLDELDSAREWMLLLGRKTAEEKVSSFLLMIAKRLPQIGCLHSKDHEEVSFELPLSRADMADFLGITIETVSRQITKLKARNLIRVTDNRTITICNMAALSDAACLDAPAEI